MQWFNIIANSSDVLISNMDLEAKVSLHRIGRITPSHREFLFATEP